LREAASRVEGRERASRVEGRERASRVRGARSGKPRVSILTEVETLRRLPAKRIANEFGAASWAKVVAELFLARLHAARLIHTIVQLAQQLTDRLEMVFFQVISPGSRRGNTSILTTKL